MFIVGIEKLVNNYVNVLLYNNALYHISPLLAHNIATTYNNMSLSNKSWILGSGCA